MSSVNDRLMIFRADTGEKLLELNCSVTQMGPPISFTIEGQAPGEEPETPLPGCPDVRVGPGSPAN